MIDIPSNSQGNGRMLSGSKSPLTPISPIRGSGIKRRALQLLVLFYFFFGFGSLNALGVGTVLRMALQHRGQGLLLVREKGVNLCLYLGGKGGRYASSPSLTIVLCRWGTGGQGEWSGWVTQGAKDSAPPLSAGGLVPCFL